MKILGVIAAYYLGIEFLQLSGYLADFTIAYCVAVYFGYRGYMGGSTGKETLSSGIEFATGNGSLYDF